MNPLLSVTVSSNNGVNCKELVSFRQTMSLFMPKKGQKKSNLAQFAWKLLESSSSEGQSDTSNVGIGGGGDGAANPAMGLHLKSIFLSLDHDNDDLLTRPQLIEAIRLTGLNPRDQLIRKYAAAMSEAASESAVFGSVDTSLVTTQANTANTNKRKQSVVAPVFFKTSLAVFVKVTETELLRRNDDLEIELVHLFETFAEPGNPEVISVKHIRHILHETLAPTRLTVLETAEFIKSCELMPKSKNSKIMDESNTFVNIRQFVSKILVGNASASAHQDANVETGRPDAADSNDFY
jgi:hypothetical protein